MLALLMAAKPVFFVDAGYKFNILPLLKKYAAYGFIEIKPFKLSKQELLDFAEKYQEGSVYLLKLGKKGKKPYAQIIDVTGGGSIVMVETLPVEAPSILAGNLFAMMLYACGISFKIKKDGRGYYIDKKLPKYMVLNVENKAFVEVVEHENSKSRLVVWWKVSDINTRIATPVGMDAWRWE